MTTKTFVERITGSHESRNLHEALKGFSSPFGPNAADVESFVREVTGRPAASVSLAENRDESVSDADFVRRIRG